MLLALTTLVITQGKVPLTQHLSVQTTTAARIITMQIAGEVIRLLYLRQPESEIFYKVGETVIEPKKYDEEPQLLSAVKEIKNHGEKPLIDDDKNLTDAALKALKFIECLPCSIAGVDIGEEIIIAYQAFKDKTSFTTNAIRKSDRTFLPMCTNAREFLDSVTTPRITKDSIYLYSLSHIIDSYKKKRTHDPDKYHPGDFFGDIYHTELTLIAETLEATMKAIKKELETS